MTWTAVILCVAAFSYASAEIIRCPASVHGIKSGGRRVNQVLTIDSLEVDLMTSDRNMNTVPIAYATVQGSVGLKNKPATPFPEMVMTYLTSVEIQRVLNKAQDDTSCISFYNNVDMDPESPVSEEVHQKIVDETKRCIDNYLCNVADFNTNLISTVSTGQSVSLNKMADTVVAEWMKTHTELGQEFPWFLNSPKFNASGIVFTSEPVVHRLNDVTVVKSRDKYLVSSSYEVSASFDLQDVRMQKIVLGLWGSASFPVLPVKISAPGVIVNLEVELDMKNKDSCRKTLRKFNVHKLQRSLVLDTTQGPKFVKSMPRKVLHFLIDSFIPGIFKATIDRGISAVSCSDPWVMMATASVN